MKLRRHRLLRRWLRDRMGFRRAARCYAEHMAVTSRDDYLRAIEQATQHAAYCETVARRMIAEVSAR